MSSRLKATTRRAISLFILVLLLVPSVIVPAASANGPDSRYFHVRTAIVGPGRVVAEAVISGPPEAPPGYLRAVSQLPEPSPSAGVNVLPDVPAFNWSFGCSATSAAMIAGYYDRTGYANMYTGPTNGGLMPLDNSAWPDWQDLGGNWEHQCPLSATHLGLDGRTTRGHVDDYWVEYLDPGPDPFIGNWPEHTYGDCTADYMKTNQSNYANVDGSTTFYNFTDGSPLYWNQMESYGIDDEDGGYGLKLFYESRGYVVTQMYNQYIRGYASPIRGFTYEQYKAEIDAGRPVMIHVEGHTMVGIGYDDASDLVYLHDTWDYGVHTMSWGGTYSGMQQYAVTVVHLASPTTSPPASPTDLAAAAVGSDRIDLAWTDNAVDETGYVVDRSLDASAWSTVTSLGADATAYSDTDLAAATTYYYRVYAYNAAGSSGYSNQASATTDQIQISNDVATADYATTYGTVTGTYEATHAQDDSYQSIVEQHSGGRPSLRYDQLEHVWTFELTGGNHIFHVDAYYVDAGDADASFLFSWATSPSGPWNDLLAVSGTADTNSYQVADLGSVSGTIYVRAVDNDRTPGENAYDTLYVDHMFVDGGAPPTEPPGQATTPNPADGAVDVTTTPTLSWTQGAGAEAHDVYLGTDLASLPPVSGGQPGTTYTPSELATNTTYYWHIDEVNSIGTTPGEVWSFTTRSTAGPTSVHVHSIVLDTVRSAPPMDSGRATVLVMDDLGHVVGAATVDGTFSGDLEESLSALSDASGTAVLTTAAVAKKPAYGFCVDDIEVDGLDYDASANAVTCATYP